jgi:predicted kinase
VLKEHLDKMDKKQTVTFLRGAPASGKSSYAKKIISIEQNVVRVSRDEIREQLNFYTKVGDNSAEKLVTEIEKENILSLLKKGLDVIIDVTLADVKYLKGYFKYFNNTGLNLEFRCQDFSHVSLEVCLERNKQRGEAGGRFVPENVIKRMHQNCISQNALHETTFNNLVKAYAENYALKDIYKDVEGHPCYIFDIDGTLALMGDRSPYEWDKVGLDTVNKNVAQLLEDLSHKSLNDTIFILSGRDGSCEIQTIEWLKKNVPAKCFLEVYMRKAGDMRPDWIVKKELLEINILDKGYRPVMIFDDRGQVCDFWKHIGITVGRVAENNF